MITEKDKETLVRLKDAAEKLRHSHIRVELCDYPSTQFANTMIKMGMYLFCSIYKQLSEEYRKKYSPLCSYLSELAYSLQSNLDWNDYRLNDGQERLLITVIESFEEEGI